MKRNHLLNNPLARTTITATATDADWHSTEWRIEPRTLTLESWDRNAWVGYHRGDKVTLVQHLGLSEYKFSGIVRYKRLGKLVVLEARDVA